MTAQGMPFVHNEFKNLVGKRIDRVDMSEGPGGTYNLQFRTTSGYYLYVSTYWPIQVSENFKKMIEGSVVEDVYHVEGTNRIDLKTTSIASLLNVDFKSGTEHRIKVDWVNPVCSAPRAFSHFDKDIQGIAEALIGHSIIKDSRGDDQIFLQTSDASGNHGTVIIRDVEHPNEEIVKNTWTQYHKVFQKGVMIHDVSIISQSAWTTGGFGYPKSVNGVAVVEAVDKNNEPVAEFRLACVSNGTDDFERLNLVVMRAN